MFFFVSRYSKNTITSFDIYISPLIVFVNIRSIRVGKTKTIERIFLNDIYTLLSFSLSFSCTLYS
jgi:hypothetical protein